MLVFPYRFPTQALPKQVQRLYLSIPIWIGCAPSGVILFFRAVL